MRCEFNYTKPAEPVLQSVTLVFTPEEARIMLKLCGYTISGLAARWSDSEHSALTMLCSAVYASLRHKVKL